MTNLDIKLKAFWDSVMKRGPSRALVEPDYAMPPAKLEKKDLQNLSVIFVREDGWSLAAPRHLENEAYNMWKDNWIGFAKKDNYRDTFQKIEDY